MIVLVMIYSVKLATRTVFPVLIVYLFRLEDMVTMKFIDINCRSGFADLTGTIFSGSNRYLKVWIVCLYLMSLNLSTSQISTEIDISYRTAYRMTTILREGIVKKSLIATLAVQLKLTKFT